MKLVIHSTLRTNLRKNLGGRLLTTFFPKIVDNGGDVDFGCGDEVFCGDVLVNASHAVDLGSIGDSGYTQTFQYRAQRFAWRFEF